MTAVSVPAADPQFTAVPGPAGGASGRVGAGAQLRITDGVLVLAQGGLLVDTDTGLPWNPKDFELITEERNPIGQINYALDANGNVVERSVGNAGTTGSGYDAAGRLAKVTCA